jgi:hypothetical protein
MRINIPIFHKIGMFIVDSKKNCTFVLENFGETPKIMQIERQLQGTLSTVFTELIKEKWVGKADFPYY